MRKYWWILIIGLVLFCSGCKNETETVVGESRDKDKDVFATYKGGTITRPDFIKWMRAQHFGERRISNILGIEKKLRGHLRRVALERLTAREAEKAGYDQGEDFKLGVKFAKKGYLIKCLRKKIRDNAWFREDCAKVRMIQFKVEDYRLVNGMKQEKLPEAELEKIFKRRMDIAEMVIDELNKGGDFAELAREYSDHNSKRTGGDIGYVYRDMQYPVIADDAFLLQIGEYTKKPLRKKDGVYIIKVEDKKEITNDNIEEEIPDEDTAMGLAMRLRAKAAVEFESDLPFADDAETYFDKFSGQDINTVLFKIGDRPFTIADFDKNMGDLDDDGQGIIFREQLKLHEALLLREAFKRGINKAPEFIEGWKIIRHSTLAAQYKNDVILSFAAIELTEEEIETEYNRLKQRHDPKILNRDDIVKLLKGRKRFAKKLNWEEDLLVKNEFRI